MIEPIKYCIVVTPHTGFRNGVYHIPFYGFDRRGYTEDDIRLVAHQTLMDAGIIPHGVTIIWSIEGRGWSVILRPHDFCDHHA